MQCYHCETPARGVCRFCGRGLCKQHQQEMPYILSMFVGEKNVAKAVVVADALYCGICKPQPDPIEIPDVY